MLGEAFVQRLLAPENRSDAFYELILRTEENDTQPRWKNLPRAVFDDAMEDIRVTECPGRDGDAPLYLVTYKENSEKWYRATHPEQAALLNGFAPGDLYPPTERPAQWNAQKGTPHLDAHALNEPIRPPGLDDKVLIYVDSKGQIQWPHGGNNLGHTGSSIADLNSDGVLERVDHENYGFCDPRDKHTTFQVLEITTIEAAPKVLLAVVLNWHPHRSDSGNRWWFEVKNRPGEPFPFIALGPQPGEREGGPVEKPLAEYHWDKASNRYLGPDGTHGDHFRRLDAAKPGDLWPKIEALQKEKGLGYPLLDNPPPSPAAPKKKEVAPLPGAWKQWPKYEHRSLAAMSNEDLFLWQYGGKPERGTPDVALPAVVIPPKLRQLSPRDAALALVDANRTQAHRKQYGLILADENKPIPKDGVLMLDVHPGWFGSYTEFIRLKAESAEWWCHALLSPSRWSHFADTGGTLRWLAEVVAWLDRVRTVPRSPAPEEYPMKFTYCDSTQMGLVWQTNSEESPAVTYPFTEPQLAGRRWTGLYNRPVAQTLAVNLWMRFSEEWSEDRRVREIPTEKAVDALIPTKPDAIPRGDCLLLKTVILSIGRAGLSQFRPRLQALSEAKGSQTLKPVVTAACNELDHRDDVPLLTAWAADDKRLECGWARMRLREIEAAANPPPGETAPSSTPPPQEPKPPETWEQLASAYRNTFKQPGAGSGPLELLLNRKEDRRRELWEIMREKFDGAQGSFADEIAAAYSADLRDFASDDLAHLATASPNEAEGSRYHYSGGEQGGMPVDGRFHLARKILAVWQEPDALTRAKLLLLLGLKNADNRDPIPSLSGGKLLDDLLKTATALDSGDRDKLVAFARWCATDAVGTVDDYPFTKVQEKWIGRVIEELSPGS